MTIVMANLLIGLAVGDIEQSRLSALYDGLVLTVDYLFKVDEAMMVKFLHKKMLNLFIHIDKKHQVRFTYRKVVGCKQKNFLRSWKKVLRIGHHAIDPSAQMEEGDTSRTIVPPTDTPTELAQIRLKLHEISEMLHHSQMEKDNGLEQYCRWKGPHLCWQVAESASQSIAFSLRCLTLFEFTLHLILHLART